MRVHDEESSVDRAVAPRRKAPEGSPVSLDRLTMSPGTVVHLQRMAGNLAVSRLLDGDGELDADPAVHVRSAINSDGGSPLPDSVRQRMEPALGSDLSSVRVHTGGTAQQSARALGAQAYTTGDHVVFGAGAYSPSSSAGQRTLAHELTHVVQQRSGPVAGTTVGGVSLSHPSDPFERAAEASADRVMAAGGSGEGAVQRQDDGSSEGVAVQRAGEGEEEEMEG
jgi:hypothetical protein